VSVLELSLPHVQEYAECYRGNCRQIQYAYEGKSEFESNGIVDMGSECRGQCIPDEGFTVDDLEQARSNMQDGKEADDKNPIELSGKCTPRNWVGWWESVKNYLKGQKGAANKPLFYIVRSRNAPIELLDEVTRVAYQMQLAGNHFNSDNQTVYRILKSLTLDTEAYAWVQPSDAASNGRQAALALMDHYDAPALFSIGRFNRTIRLIN
jgi:hypothetical protein